jgi:hypothetical protein
MKNSRQPLARMENVVVQEMPEETLVYDLQTNKAFCLNQTAALVWKNCTGTKSVAEIAEIVGKETKSVVTDEFVWLAIDQLGKDNLLENKPEAPVFMKNGVSRRDAMRRIGLATAVALPLVAALSVPSAAFASNSCVNNPCVVAAGGGVTTACANPCTCSGAGNPAGGTFPCIV